MRASEWQQSLQQYRERHGKVVFTPTELANISGHSMPVLKNTLRRLCSRGILQQYVPGKYGLPGAVTIEGLVSSVDIGAYITGQYALHKHALIKQVPRRIDVFTNRRHNRSRIRKTDFGSLVFVCVKRPVYSRPKASAMAGPEQSLCDFVYLLRRRGLSADSLVSFRELRRLDITKLEGCLTRYPKTVERELHRLLSTETDGYISRDADSDPRTSIR
jgi:hypothetical protein